MTGIPNSPFKHLECRKVNYESYRKRHGRRRGCRRGRRFSPAAAFIVHPGVRPDSERRVPPLVCAPWENLGGRKEGNHRCTWVDADQRSISSSPFHAGGNARNSSFVTHPWENLGGLRGVYPGMLPQRMRKLPEGGKRSLRFVRVTCGHLTEKEMQ